MTLTAKGQIYKVKLTTERIGGDDGPRSFLGETDQGENLIVIDGTMPKTRQEEVLLHELLHLADMTCPEVFVGAQGENLYGILRENGMLAGTFLSRVLDGAVTRAEMARLNEESAMMAGGPFHGPGIARRVTDAPWDGAASRFTIEQWRRSCILHLDGDPDLKATHKLPVREPNGDVNRAGAHAAAAVLGGARGGVDAPAAKKRAAARALITIYRRDLDEEPPESLRDVAGG